VTRGHCPVANVSAATPTTASSCGGTHAASLRRLGFRARGGGRRAEVRPQRRGVRRDDVSTSQPPSASASPRLVCTSQSHLQGGQQRPRCTHGVTRRRQRPPPQEPPGLRAFIPAPPAHVASVFGELLISWRAAMGPSHRMAVLAGHIQPPDETLLVLSPAVREALSAGRAVVALESTIITHGGAPTLV
jgi:hypothetical protein